MEDLFDEKKRLKELQKKFKEVEKLIVPIGKIKAEDSEFLTQLEKALVALPAGDAVGQRIDELKQNGVEYLKAVKKQRSTNFGRIIADFVRGNEEQGIKQREVGDGWRINKLYMKTIKDFAQVRFYYNDQALGPAITVTCASQISDEMKKNLDLLEKCKLPEAVLVSVVWQAYVTLMEKMKREESSGAAIVALSDFHCAFRSQLAFHQLINSKPAAKLDYSDFPCYAFLYNLDIYRRLKLTEKRIGFQTGSQHETRTNGYILNGLNPMEDYKMFCHVISAG